MLSLMVNTRGLFFILNNTPFSIVTLEEETCWTVILIYNKQLPNLYFVCVQYKTRYLSLAFLYLVKW